MIHLLATRGAATKLRTSPFTETAVSGIHSLVYKAGVEPISFDGSDLTAGERGTYGRGLHRLSGFLFSYDGSVAETLLAIVDDVDLIVRYRASGEKRVRTLADVVFVGDATVVVPALNQGVPELIGVPFRVQIPVGDSLSNHVTDMVDS